MVLLRRLIPLFIGLLFIGGSELLIAFPGLTMRGFGLLGILVFFSAYLLTRPRESTTTSFAFALLPTLFALSFALFFLFIERSSAKHVLTIVVAAGLYIYFEQVYTFLFQPHRYPAYALEYTSAVMHLLITFFLFTSAYSLYIFLHFSLPMLLGGVFFMAGLLTWHLLWVHKIEWNRSRSVMVILALLATEFFWAIHFLPTSTMTLGILTASFFYAMVHMSRWHLTSAIEKHVLRRYAILLGLVLLLTLGSARWV